MGHLLYEVIDMNVNRPRETSKSLLGRSRTDASSLLMLKTKMFIGRVMAMGAQKTRGWVRRGWRDTASRRRITIQKIERFDN